MVRLGLLGDGDRVREVRRAGVRQDRHRQREGGVAGDKVVDRDLGGARGALLGEGEAVPLIGPRAALQDLEGHLGVLLEDLPFDRSDPIEREVLDQLAPVGLLRLALGVRQRRVTGGAGAGGAADVEREERRSVDVGEMPGGGADEDRMGRGDRVERRPRVAVLQVGAGEAGAGAAGGGPQARHVVAEGEDRRRGGGGRRDRGAEPVEHLVLAGGRDEAALRVGRSPAARIAGRGLEQEVLVRHVEPVRPVGEDAVAHEVRVGVDEPRQDGRAMEVDQRGAGTPEIERLRLGADGHDLAARDGDRLGQRLRAFHGDEGGVVEDRLGELPAAVATMAAASAAGEQRGEESDETAYRPHGARLLERCSLDGTVIASANPPSPP